MSEKKVIVLFIAITIIGVLGWIGYESRPKPGTLVDDLGRDHVPVGTKVEYNSNPPTSGNHYEEWVRAGVFDRPQEDGYLIHSLEHGYVIISYNCSFKQSFNFIPTVLAHGIDEQPQNNASSNPQAIKTATEDSTASALMGNDFRNDECHSLVDNLTKIFEEKGGRKIIIIPRPSLDAQVALTAWRRLDKLNKFDESRIKKFIDSFRDQGPEKTTE